MSTINIRVIPMPLKASQPVSAMTIQFLNKTQANMAAEKVS